MLAATVVTALVGSVAEGFVLVLLLPLLAVAGMSFNDSSTAGRWTADAQGLLVAAHVPHGLWLPLVLGIFLAVGTLRSLLRRSQVTMASATLTRAELALSRRVYESLVKAQWAFLVRQRSGRLAHVLTAELRHVGEAISYLLSLINIACLTVLYLTLAFKLSVAMTLLVLVLGGGLMLQQRRSLARVRATGQNFFHSIGEVYAATDEHLLNLKSVKTNNAEERDVQMFAALCGDVARHAVENVKQQAASAFRFEMGTLVALGGVIYLALAVLHVQAPTMLLLLAVFTRLMPQLATFQSQSHLAAAALPSFDNVLAIEADCRAHAEGAAGADLERGLQREFRLENVWFAYNLSVDASDAAEPAYVLRGIDLTVEAGLLTALVGPSGSGKSTLADLINGLLQPTRGQLLLDGVALDASATLAWRRQVGYVGQETVLFHKSVRENLLWAKPDATEEELREALELAAADFIYDLREGLETVVGDRGILLSSGQRQRISLARALLRKPALLILDEATNALDVENEARVLDAICGAIRKSVEDAKQGRGAPLAVLMIAHRASAIRRADRVYELAEGQIPPPQPV